MRFRQFCGIAKGIGLRRGDTLLYDKVRNISTAGRAIAEDEAMPQSKVVIAQDSMTVTEYGNSIPYTGKLEALAEFDPQNIAQRALRDDMAKTLDSLAGAQFTGTDLVMIPTGTVSSPTRTMKTDGTTGVVIARNPMVTDLKYCRRYLQKLNVPPYDGENYIAILSVEAMGGIEDDAAFIAAAQYGDPDRLFSGEVGRVAGVRCLLENNVLSNTKGAAAGFGEGVVFGADAVQEGVTIADEIRAKIPTDYGRDKGVAWYFLGGWDRIWDYSTDAYEPCIYITGDAS
jgi:N4-gp56 family major capsid protein